MKEGYYWVKYCDEWIIAELDLGVWFSHLYEDDIVPELIGDYIEMPGKYKEKGK